MTKEELEKEAEVCMHNALFWLKLPISKENVEKGSSYILELLEPREKRIEELEEISTRLESYYQNQKVRIAELEAQIEKMKCCGNCAKYNSGYGENPCKIGASMICGEWETSIGKF